MLLHYVADAFTLTHNDGFSGGVLAHNRYEAKLKDVFARTLFTHPLGAAALAQGSARDFPSLFLRAHPGAIWHSRPGPDTDTRFISGMTLLAFSLFVPHSAFQTPLEEPA